MRLASRVCLGVLLLAVAAAADELKLGDPAPAFSVTDWVKGGPADPAKPDGRTVYVVEFWATWCGPCLQTIPHLTELQRKYRSDGLVVIGVAYPGQGESLQKVRDFVGARGDAMDYVVAYDGDSQTHDRYLVAAGALGIPHAFVIDKTGKVIWQGHPAAGLDAAIPQILKGTYSVDQAIAQQQRSAQALQIMAAMAAQAQAKDWDGLKGSIGRLVAIDPANSDALNWAFYAYLQETDDAAGLRTLLTHHLDDHRDDAGVNAQVAGALLDIGPVEYRQPDLLLRAAARASELADPGDADAVQLYARAAFEVGLLDKAIELQRQAVERAPPDQRDRAQRVLDTYQACKALRAGD